MKPVILDSSALFSVASIEDVNNKKAQKIVQSLFAHDRLLILPTEIFSELLNIAGKKNGRALQNVIFHDLTDSEIIIFPKTTKAQLISTFHKLQTLPASVSFTDALVMAYADEYHTKEIFGFDHIFEQQGYQLPNEL